MSTDDAAMGFASPCDDVNAVFGLDAADLGDGHERDPIPAATFSKRPPGPQRGWIGPAPGQRY